MQALAEAAAVLRSKLWDLANSLDTASQFRTLPPCLRERLTTLRQEAAAAWRELVSASRTWSAGQQGSAP